MFASVITVTSNQNIPNPFPWLKALINLSFSFSLVEYAHSNKALKHVWAVGSL